MSKSNSLTTRNVCDLCCHEAKAWAVGECDHPICLPCCAKMRVLCDVKDCAVCRLNLSQSEKLQNMYIKMKSYFCNLCLDGQNFRSFRQLREHFSKTHNLYYCDICVDNLKLFPSEFKTYSRGDLVRHRREGDPDDTCYKGHPLCHFCDDRFLDNDTLHSHLRKDHFWCHFCENDGKQDYYIDYPSLRHHFKSQHYLCEEGECRQEKFTSAYRSKIDLQVHCAAKHTKGLSKAEVKQMKQIDVGFSYGRGAGSSRDHEERMPPRHAHVAGGGRGGPGHSRNTGRNAVLQQERENLELASAISASLKTADKTKKSGRRSPNFEKKVSPSEEKKPPPGLDSSAVAPNAKKKFKTNTEVGLLKDEPKSDKKIKTKNKTKTGAVGNLPYKDEELGLNDDSPPGFEAVNNRDSTVPPGFEAVNNRDSTVPPGFEAVKNGTQTVDEVAIEVVETEGQCPDLCVNDSSTNSVGSKKLKRPIQEQDPSSTVYSSGSGDSFKVEALTQECTVPSRSVDVPQPLTDFPVLGGSTTSHNSTPQVPATSGFLYSFPVTNSTSGTTGKKKKRKKGGHAVTESGVSDISALSFPALSAAKKSSNPPSSSSSATVPTSSMTASTKTSESQVVCNVRTALDNDEKKFNEFQTISGWYRSGTVSVDVYATKCSELFGLSWQEFAPKVARMIPAGSNKRNELLSLIKAHQHIATRVDSVSLGGASYLSASTHGSVGVVMGGASGKKGRKNKQNPTIWSTNVRTTAQTSGFLSENDYPSLSVAAKQPGPPEKGLAPNPWKNVLIQN